MSRTSFSVLSEYEVRKREDLTAVGEGKLCVEGFVGMAMLTVAELPLPRDSPRTQFFFMDDDDMVVLCLGYESCVIDE